MLRFLMNVVIGVLLISIGVLGTLWHQEVAAPPAQPQPVVIEHHHHHHVEHHKVKVRAAKKQPAAPAADLPWSCDTIRYYTSHFSKSELKKMGEQNGIKLTPAQRRAVDACVNGG